MKKTTKIILIIGITLMTMCLTQAQTSITNILDDLQWDLRLGCCQDDDDHHPDFPICAFGEYQEYIINGDANINENHLRIDNAYVTVTGDFYSVEGNVTFSPNCTSTLTIEGDLIYVPGTIDIEHQGLKVIGKMIEATLSLKQFARTLNKGEIFIIYNSLGQMLRTGTYKDVSDLYSNEIRYIKFPKLNYSSRMMIK